MRVIFKFLFACCFSFAANLACCQIIFHPQVGGNYDDVIGQFEGYSDDGARLGIVAGLDLRFPDRTRFNFNPGIFYSNVQANLIGENGDEEVLEIERMRVPVRLGLYLSDPENVVKVRTNIGLQGSWLLEIKDSNEVLSEEDFHHTVLDATAGVGIDVLFLTFDLSYTHGLSAFTRYNSSRSNLITATVGLALNPGGIP